MSPVRRPRAASVSLTALVAVLLTGAALTGCSGDKPSAPRRTTPSSAADSGTSLQDLGTSALVVRRAPFCELVDPAAVTRALGAEAEHAASYRSGQRTKVSKEVTDVVHEFGCVWKAGESTAKAWVFVPPVTKKRARALAKDASARSGCRVLPGAARFGVPTAAVSCRLLRGIEVSYSGLFGDAWLSCTLTFPSSQQAELTDRAGRWCAAVAEAASAPTSAG